MSELRNKLEHARDAYGRLQYPGDLADDVFARLDAEQAQASMRIMPAKPKPAAAFGWRPMLALAATVAVIATTIFTLTHTGSDRSKDDVAVKLPTDIAPPAPTNVVETPTVVAEATDFTVVPAYQSLAFSVPTSLSLASVDEYDRQAQEESKSTDAAVQ